MKLVIVKFVDPTTYNHWTPKETIQESSCRVCLAHGRLLSEGEDNMKIGLLSSDDGEAGSDWVVIPKGAILASKVIKGDIDG